MKRDLKGMGKNKQGADQQQRQQTGRPQQQTNRPQQPAREQPKMQQQDINNINDAIEHFGGKSEAELMSELVNFRNQGAFDDAKLNEVAARIAPLLNAQQKKRLESVLGTLKNK